MRVQPHHTDHAGVVWHGSYVSWMEEARIECLRSRGVAYSDLVELGCTLPVVELSLRYHRPLKMGDEAIVKTRLAHLDRVRVIWQYQIESSAAQALCVSARVTLVAVDSASGKILRQLPLPVKEALASLTEG